MFDSFRRFLAWVAVTQVLAYELHVMAQCLLRVQDSLTAVGMAQKFGKRDVVRLFKVRNLSKFCKDLVEIVRKRAFDGSAQIISSSEQIYSLHIMMSTKQLAA